MFTKRDTLIALVAVCATLSIMTLAQSEKRLMESSAFDWNTTTVKPTKVGERRDLFRSPTATLDELESHVTTINPGEMPHPPHKHPHEEVIIIKEGTVEVTFNDQTKTLGPGSMLFYASNQMHGMRNIGKVPATYFVITWKSPGMLKEGTK